MKRVCFFCLIFTCLLPLTAYSRRMAPAKVQPVIYGGIRYEAPPVPMGHILAYDVATSKLLWEKKLYKAKTERDKHVIFIKELKILSEEDKGDVFLIAIDEREQEYRVNIKDPQADFIYKEVFLHEIDSPLLNKRLAIPTSIFEVDFFTNERLTLLIDDMPLFSKFITTDWKVGIATSIKIKKAAGNVKLTIIIPQKKITRTCFIDLSKGSYIAIHQNKGQLLIAQRNSPF